MDKEAEATDSPLAEVAADALDELLARDPKGLTLEDKGRAIEILVREFRKARKEWERKDAEAHAKGKHGRGPKRELPEGAKTIYDLTLG